MNGEKESNVVVNSFYNVCGNIKHKGMTSEKFDFYLLYSRNM